MAYIQIVDDDASIVALLEFMLEQAGHETTSASDGLKALAALGVEPAAQARLPDLILMDINMPGMDGYTLSQRLAEHQAARAVPIVVITTKGQLRDVFQAAPNVVDFLEKPFTGAALAAVVAKALTRRRP